MKIKFIKSPTGKYNLAYNIGGIWDCKDSKLADEIIKAGYAEQVEVKKTSKKVNK